MAINFTNSKKNPVNCQPKKALLNSSLLAGILSLSPFNTIPASADQPNQPTTPNPATTATLNSYSKLPLTFEVNQGQSDPQVKFLSRGRGYNLFLTPTEAVLALHAAQQSAANTKLTTKSAVLRMQLVGANSTPQIAGVKESGKVNYLIGKDSHQWHTNVPTYAQVRYQGVYPGVDMVYYGNQQQLEYDFIVAPQADPKAITLNFQGMDKLEVNAQGDLVLQTGKEAVHLHKPVVYQQVNGVRRKIASRYLLKGKGQVGFQIAAYDTNQPLVIDPVLSYSTFLGGTSDEFGVGIAVDSAGQAYVTGRTTSIDFPIKNAFQVKLGDTGATSVIGDAFVTKLNAAGNGFIYSTYLGGNKGESGGSIAVDSAGNAYITGGTASPNFPVKNALQTALKGVTDAFVVKLNATGGLVYSSYLGGDDTDSGGSIAIDKTGKAYITGSSRSTNFPIKNAFQNKFSGFEDAFVTKVNPAASGAASLVYSSYLGGTNGDNGGGIAVDSANNAYVTGITSSANFPTSVNAFQKNFGGSNGNPDAFVTKVNAAGNGLIYSTYLGGSKDDRGLGIAVDSAGNAYVTGFTSSIFDFPTKNALQNNYGGGARDPFLTKLNATGSSLVYSTYLGGNDVDEGFAIAVDSAGNAYVTGETSSKLFPIVDAFQDKLGGFDDAFVTKVNAAGSARIYSSFLGGSGFEEGRGIALDGNGNAYITGRTSSLDFPTKNPIQLGLKGFNDAFISKIKP